MARQEQRDELVAKLAVRHPLSIRVILRRQEQRDDISTVATVAPPSFDEVLDHAIERRSCGAESSHLRQRKTIGERRERQDGNLEQTRRRLERTADLGSHGVAVGAEQDSPRDAQREAAHLGGDIDGVPFAPRVAPLGREPRHDARIVVEPHAMKGRLNKAPLAGMQRAVARQQPVAEEAPRAAQRSPFDEPMMVRHQHVLDVVGMIQKKDMERAKPDVDDVAVLGADPRQKRQRIAPDVGKASEKQPARRPRWKHAKILLCPRRVEGRY